MMNIISVEDILQGVTIIKEKFKNTPHYFKYGIDILKHQNLLDKMTNNLVPEDLFKEMHIIFQCELFKVKIHYLSILKAELRLEGDYVPK